MTTNGWIVLALFSMVVMMDPPVQKAMTDPPPTMATMGQ